jgi:hypothetical protein
MFGKTKKEKQEDNKETDVEYADYEICRKSKVGEYLQTGQEFFVVDMKKKKIYSSTRSYSKKQIICNTRKEI